MTYGPQSSDTNSTPIPIGGVYNPDGNTFPALAGEQGAYVDASSNPSSAAIMSFLRSRTVQSASNKSSGNVASLAKLFTNNNTAGNSIIVCCGVGNGTAPTVTDSAGNTYTQIGQVANGTAFNVAIFLGTGATLGAGIASGANTVTVNNGGSTASIAMEIYEIFGVLAIPVAQPDQKASATGTSGTAATTAISASFPNELAFAAIGVGTAAQTITVGSGWANDSGQQNPTTPAGLFSFVSMSQFLGSQSPVTPQATFTSEPWAIVVATFKTVVVPIAGTVNASQICSEQASLTANALNAFLVPITDVSMFKAFSLHVTAMASGGTITFQGSNTTNDADFKSILAVNLSSNASFSPTASSTGLFAAPIAFRYLRVKQTGWSSGTTTGVLELYTFTPNFIQTTITGALGFSGSTIGTVRLSQNNAVVPANTAEDTVIEDYPGTLSTVVVTVQGTVAISLYDNASESSGNVLLTIPANAPVGSIYSIHGATNNGITAGGVANCPGLAVYFV